MKKIPKKLVFLISGCLIIIALVLISVFLIRNRIDVACPADVVRGVFESDSPKSSLIGIRCENAGKRPIAVMFSSDAEVRPLSGIGQADVVFEMPVTPPDNTVGVTRMMAIFNCEQPEQIGSIRSARQDFISLAASFNAVLAHWGGEKEALAKLNNGIIDNIDAMKYENTYFYRKSSKPMPHNGFSDFDLLWEAIENLGYNQENKFSGYSFKDPDPKQETQIIEINYDGPFKVRWEYDSEKNAYLRFRNNEPEIDKNTSKQVEVSVVIVMETTWSHIGGDYIDVNVTGKGNAEIYQNGEKQEAIWEKDGAELDSKLEFSQKNKEVEFVSGKKWIEIVF